MGGGTLYFWMAVIHKQKNAWYMVQIRIYRLLHDLRRVPYPAVVQKQGVCN
ncbi:hypothetical protein BH20ACI2_BH20ACI2_20630 [soil metagenome]